MASPQQAKTSRKGKVENVSLDVSGPKKCVVCDDILDSAKVLPCTHIFCDSCLDSYLETLSDTENEFPCPMCKVMSPSPRRISAKKKIRDQNQHSTIPATSTDQEVPPIDIPGSEDTSKQEANDKSLRDTHLETLTSIRISNGYTSTPVTARETKRDVKTPHRTKVKGKSSSPKNGTLTPYRKCNPCEEMNEIHDAVNFCMSCRESMCAECSRTHKGMKLTKDHILTPLEEIEPNQLNQVEVSEFCPDHMRNPMVLYCEDHRMPCCNTCVAVHHVRCTNVLSMDRLATLLQEKKASKLLMARLKQSLLNIDNMTERKAKSQRHLLEQKERSLHQMGQFKDSLIKLIDDLEKRFTDEVENLYDDHLLAIQTHADKTAKIETALRNSIKTLKTTMKHGSDTQQVLMIQTLTADCERFERMIHVDKINFKDYNFTFMPGEELEASLRTVPSVGIVEIVHKKYFGDLLSCSAKKEGVINVKVPGDNENCIANSVDITDEGDIILSDYNNMKIKLFDQHGIFRSSIKVNSGPRGVAYLYERKVAVSLPDENLIQILSIEGKYLSQFRNIYTQFKAYRLSFFGNQRMLAICDSESHKAITVITFDGQVERQISKKKGVRGLGGVCFDPVKTYAYISDKEVVTGYTYAGKRRFQYKFKRTDLRGMTCDLQGNVYVCSRDTRQILQLSPEGKLIKTIVVPMSPQDVAMEPQSNKMVVCGMGNIVHVYRIV
ncbi:hypothetical protein CHS0354_042825 [Potamilus streckersoni]|uniref:Uncharacterized protein n=1 Tax=Potamilus streckersoni TaxID=2493646 RepID=A0AAE0T4T4_9BIVA|nr:hypothetical protein CHS0354_042825 [Potamilus streckersoni]